MELQTYLDLLKKQRALLTQEQIAAINKQQQFSAIAFEKQKIKDDLEEQYRILFSKGCQKLFEMFPEVHDALPASDTYIGSLQNIFDMVNSHSPLSKEISSKMKMIPELNESIAMNEKVAKAYFDFFIANDELNRQIDSDHKVLFTAEYSEKIRELADDGVFLYFLETPDLPLLDKECTSKYILESFSFADYLSARTLFSSFCNFDNPGEPLKRKLEDAHAALEMMYNGSYRSAARNWFALIEHEHKRCADTLEGYWETKREFKNGKMRSEKIFQIIDNMLSEWDKEAWEKIDTYYKKITEHPKDNSSELNRNAIIHGDYTSDSLDVTEHDAMRLFLMWVNLRIITDRLAFVEEFLENKVTMLPYFCTVGI